MARIIDDVLQSRRHVPKDLFQSGHGAGVRCIGGEIGNTGQDAEFGWLVLCVEEGFFGGIQEIECVLSGSVVEEGVDVVYIVIPLVDCGLHSVSARVAGLALAVVAKGCWGCNRCAEEGKESGGGEELHFGVKMFGEDV